MMNLRLLPQSFGIYQLHDIAAATDWLRTWESEPELVWSLSRSPSELSLICPTRTAPRDPAFSQGAWRGVYFVGQLDFSLVGVLSRLVGILAEAGLGVLALSTYDTDYVFVPETALDLAMARMAKNGYILSSDGDAVGK